VVVIVSRQVRETESAASRVRRSSARVTSLPAMVTGSTQSTKPAVARICHGASMVLRYASSPPQCSRLVAALGGWTWPARLQRWRPRRSPPPSTMPYCACVFDTATIVGARSCGKKKCSHGLYGWSEMTPDAGGEDAAGEDAGG